MRALALLLVAPLLACSREGSPQRDSAVATSPAPSPPARVAPPEYAVGNHVFRLMVAGDACVLEHRGADAKTEKLTLDLHPPCHLLTWRQPPSPGGQGGGVSDGQAIGTTGDPMAWQYASAAGAITLAVIGDPVPESLRASSLYRLREQQGLSCGSSVQGVLLRGDQIQLSKKREHAGVFCAELGLEEKDFWTLAHP